MAYTPYPPPAAGPILTAIDIIRSSQIQARKRELGKAAWMIHGMVSGVALGEPDEELIVGCDCDNCDCDNCDNCDPEVVAAMGQLANLYIADQPQAVAQTAKALPWFTILMWLLQLLASKNE